MSNSTQSSSAGVAMPSSASGSSSVSSTANASSSPESTVNELLTHLSAPKEDIQTALTSMNRESLLDVHEMITKILEQGSKKNERKDSDVNGKPEH